MSNGLDHKFKVGERVLVKKPHDTREPPSWIGMMDKYDGGVFIVIEIKPWIKLSGTFDLSFNPAWLKSVDWFIKHKKRMLNGY